jgi:hypothetical protein
MPKHNGSDDEAERLPHDDEEFPDDEFEPVTTEIDPPLPDEVEDDTDTDFCPDCHEELPLSKLCDECGACPACCVCAADDDDEDADEDDEDEEA